MPLTDARLRTLKPELKPRKVSDFEGLFLLVTPSGSRLWRMAYRFAGKQKVLALGAYPDLSLRDARKARDDARDLLAKGEDPANTRRLEKLKAKVRTENTFGAVANEWVGARESGWVATYSERLRRRLDTDLIPQLGKRPIAEIEPIELLGVPFGCARVVFITRPAPAAGGRL